MPGPVLDEAAVQTDGKAAAATGAASAKADGTGAPADDHAALQERLAGYCIGALTSNLIALGEKLGLYAALKKLGPCTAAELAAHLELNQRYVAEWLRQQAAARVISADADAGKFWLTEVQQDVLVHEHGQQASPFFFLGGFCGIPGLAKTADEKLPVCFKDGSGISYDEIERGVTCGTCRELGVWIRHCLVACLCRVPGLEEALRGGCQVADVGCGGGEAVLTAAAAFPASTFHGYDISEEALRIAREEAARRGLTNCSFFNAGLEEEALPKEPAYRLVMTHDAIHDMALPQKVMAAVRKAVTPDGCWIVGDMSALESHGANVHGHPLAAFLYGFSVHLCLPSGMSAPGAAALGTLGISTQRMGDMMREAGFRSTRVLEDWDHPLNRYYIAEP